MKEDALVDYMPKLEEGARILLPSLLLDVGAESRGQGPGAPGAGGAGGVGAGAGPGRMELGGDSGPAR